MSVFTAANIVVAGGGASTPSPSGNKIPQWANNASYADGQLVTFNGSLYVATGNPAVGLIPPIEVATPQIPGQPKWSLAVRGRTVSSAWDYLVTYYADQVVTFQGGTYILDAATVPAGTRPNRDKRWLRLSETLTEAEAEKVSSSDVSAVAADCGVTIFANGDEDARVAHHWIRVIVDVPIVQTTLYVMKFPRAIKSQARPAISVLPADQISAFMILNATPIVSGNECTGYRISVNNGSPAGTAEFLVTVKEAIDQVSRL